MSENGHNGKYTAEQFIKAIPGSGGIITKIAERVGCTWHTARRYIEKHPTVLQAYTDEKEKVIDLAETTVMKAMSEGDVGTARWYLATKGRDRGYVERRQHEHSGPEGGPIVIVNWDDERDDTG